MKSCYENKPLNSHTDLQCLRYHFLELFHFKILLGKISKLITLGGPDPSSPKVSVVCIFWHHPQFSHVPVHKITPSPSGSASWSPSGDLHVHHLSEVAFLFLTVHMPKPSEPVLPCFAFYTPYPQLFSDIFTLHFVFHCHPLDSSQHSHFCLL